QALNSLRLKLLSQRHEFVRENEAARHIPLISELKSLLIFGRYRVRADLLELMIKQGNQPLPISKIEDVFPIEIGQQRSPNQIDPRSTRAEPKTQPEQIVLTFMFERRHAGFFLSIKERSLVDLQDCQKCFLRDVHAAYLLHSLLAFFLFLEQ